MQLLNSIVVLGLVAPAALAEPTRVIRGWTQSGVCRAGTQALQCTIIAGRCCADTQFRFTSCRVATFSAQSRDSIRGYRSDNRSNQCFDEITSARGSNCANAAQGRITGIKWFPTGATRRDAQPLEAEEPDVGDLDVMDAVAVEEFYQKSGCQRPDKAFFKDGSSWDLTGLPNDVYRKIVDTGMEGGSMEQVPIEYHRYGRK